MTAGRTAGERGGTVGVTGFEEGGAVTDVSTSPLPAIMDDAALEREIAARRREGHELFKRRERPDPWPMVAEQYPRIAADIRARWGQQQLDDYIAGLVIDDRGGRAGFPPDVLAAILEIGRLHANRFRFGRAMCPWDHDVSTSKWWDRL